MKTSGLIIEMLIMMVSMAWGQPRFQVIDLGPDFEPGGLNDRHTIVGSSTLPGPQSMARWREGQLEIFGPGRLDAVNGSGLAVGYSWVNDDLNQAAARLLGPRTSRLAMPPGFLASEATCIEARGRAYGFGFDTVNVSPLAWGALGSAVVRLPGLGSDAGIFGCSSNGEYKAGFAINASGDLTCVVWDAAGAITELPGLNGGALCGGISETGVTVGVAWADDLEFAVKWVDGSIEILPFVQGGILAEASGVNSAGWITGTQWGPEIPTGRGVLWTLDGAVYDLNDLLVDAPFGLLLTSAGAINTAGSIVATGTLHGEPHGFLLMLMAPAAARAADTP